MVTVAELEVPEYEPVPEPTHLSKAYPLLAVALIGTVEPASYQPELGETEPPPDGLVSMVK
jgi:hypothetical protein